MLRNFNSTGRQKILNEHAQVVIHPAAREEAPLFDVDLQLARYNFEPDAAVRVEAWRTNISQRWSFGTIGQLKPPREVDRRMTVAPVESQFKVFVVAADGSGRLLGATGPIKPKLPRESLIPLQEKELEGEVWRVNFGDDDLPILEVNNQLEQISEIVRSDAAFRSLVMPQVLRTVLTQILLVEEADADDDEEGWHSGWLRLAQAHVPGRPPKVTDRSDSGQRQQAQTWIDQVVGKFSAERVQAVAGYRAGQAAGR